MRWHIVRALSVMQEHRVAIGDEFREKRLEIGEHIRVRVFTQGQRRARVPEENVAKTVFDTAVGDLPLYLRSDVVGRAPSGIDDELGGVTHAWSGTTGAAGK